ncbi:T9SS type A sorting domain-containing protein [Brumimicrobium mesophilum]|uniref:T9SS type A sorting domain-containing protein n=1 Tax=Brumimicrobium mesophilum TaxID=392717 RepID=UPI000D14000E|nr:T9SS type A sorting domain-containing protein [Brumimicrobium mesophilum]
MKKILLSFTLLFTFITTSQTLQISDQYVFGGSANDSPRDALVINNQTIVGGVSSSGISGDKTTSNFGDLDLWIISVDNTNSIVWQKSFGGTGLDDLVKIIETSDGNILIGGSSGSGVNGNKTSPNKGMSDFWLIKMDNQGNELWQKSYGGEDDEFLGDMVELNDGSVLLVGGSTSPISGDKTESSFGESDAWIVKIDAQGNLLWDKTIGGNAGDALVSIALDDNDNIYFSGSSESSISGVKTEDSFGGYDYWVLKLDQNGNILWDKTLGGSGAEFSHYLIYSDNRLFVIGHSTSDVSGTKTETSRGAIDIWIAKLNQNGEVLMDKTIGGNYFDKVTGPIITESGELVMVGTSDSDISVEVTIASHNNSADFWILVNDTSDLSIKNQYKIGSDLGDFSPGILEIENNSLLLYGSTEANISGDKTVPSNGGLDYWILELSTNLSTSNFQNEESLSIYPNPTSNKFVISNLPSGESYELNILDMTGRTVLLSKVSSSNNSVDVNSLSPGMYTLHMYDGITKYTSKLIVE